MIDLGEATARIGQDDIVKRFACPEADKQFGYPPFSQLPP